MRDVLTAQEMELIFAYADYDMRVKPTTDSKYVSRTTLWRTFQSVFSKTGLDPTKFWDLHNLIIELGKEGVNARTIQVSAQQDRSDDG